MDEVNEVTITFTGDEAVWLARELMEAEPQPGGFEAEGIDRVRGKLFREISQQAPKYAEQLQPTHS
jgi:hypothetical protein